VGPNLIIYRFNSDNLTNDELFKLRQIRAGDYLTSLRTKRRLTQKGVASQLSVSFQYLSEIEKGNKSPSDLLLHKFAEIFELDLKNEVKLFKKYGRLPLLTVEELQEQPSAQLVLAEIRMLKKYGKITNRQRQELYAEFSKIYRNFIARVLPQKEDIN